MTQKYSFFLPYIFCSVFVNYVLVSSLLCVLSLFLFCFLSPSFSFLLPCPILSHFVLFLVPLPGAFLSPFFYHFILLLFRRSCPFLLLASSVGLQFAGCKGWAHMLFANLCLHTHTHRLTIRMPLLIPEIATMTRKENTTSDITRSFSLYICFFPFPLHYLCLSLLHLSCLIVLCPVHFFLFPFLFLLLSAAISRP